MVEREPMSLSADVLRDIRYRLVQGLETREQIFASMLENRPDELADLHGELREAIDMAFAAKAEHIATWPAVTDNDRLLVAFAALDGAGILALESPGDTQEEAIRQAVAQAAIRAALARPVHGYCFFTWNDMARAIDGEGLTLAYGTFDEAETATSPTPEQKVGAAVVAACRDAGLDVEWSGSDEDFIELPRFKWQRR